MNRKVFKHIGSYVITALKKVGIMVIVKLQDRPSGKYSSKVLTLPKQLMDKIIKILGEEPYGFDIDVDKKGKVTGEPVFLKKK
jgi:hypothetical protein